MKKELFSMFLAIIVIPCFAQDHLSDYVHMGLENNQLLKEKNISLEQSLLLFKTAKSHFLPSVAFTTDYLSGEGGRTIAFPAGDLLNPVYSTLNQLTSSVKFPQINNVNEQLLPNNFYDTRFHISYSLLNTDLYYNKEISRQGVIMREYDLDIYRQELIKEIKQAYFTYCSSQDGVSIYIDAFGLVSRNLKLTQSLLKNGKGLPANLLRAESEQQNIIAKIIEAENIRTNARNYLNFLINRPLTDSVIFEKHEFPDSLGQIITETPDTKERGELKQIGTEIEMSYDLVRLNKSVYIPKLSTFLDLGSQASNFQYNATSRYYYFGAQLDVPLFSGGRNQNNIKLARLDRESLDLQRDFLSQRLQLTAETARSNLVSSYAAYSATEKQLIAATSYFKLIDKGFKEGSNSLIEFIDARNQLTSATLILSIKKYNVLIQLAEYERQTVNSKIK